MANSFYWHCFLLEFTKLLETDTNADFKILAKASIKFEKIENGNFFIKLITKLAGFRCLFDSDFYKFARLLEIRPGILYKIRL